MQALKKSLGAILVLAVVAVPILALSHAQAIEDWFKLRGYTPPAAISSLATQDSMTPKSIHIFYVNHPQLDNDALTFRQHCAQSEQTIVLGCYHSNQSGITVYNVNDARLSGVQQVTAAHEMLHAAYDRLSKSERNRVDQLLTDYYKNNLTDQRVKDTINSYKSSEPTELVNEMHSIFGTEVANLPAPLENYYKQYFTDRSKVVAYANSYEGEFTSRLAQISDYDQQLADLKQQITAEEATLSAQLASIQNDRAAVERSNDETAINNYNGRVAAYNSGVRKLQRDIVNYNSLVEQRNAVAAELKSLQGALDTRLTAQPAQ